MYVPQQVHSLMISKKKKIKSIYFKYYRNITFTYKEFFEAVKIHFFSSKIELNSHKSKNCKNNKNKQK